VYQKKSQLEHVLLRPDTYIGSVEKQSAPMWVHVQAGASDVPGAAPKLEQRTISYVPGLFKIFDEILVNAADNKQRDATMTCLRVDIDAAAGSVRVYNDGAGIPVEMHKTEGVYVPELIFGHLLTSSNYDDSEKKARLVWALAPQAARRPAAPAPARAPRPRGAGALRRTRVPERGPASRFSQVVGGRNGFGAKLANIFSTEFVVETCDGKRGRRFRQVFRANMSAKGEPVITACKATDNWTCITFKPDLAKFGMVRPAARSPAAAAAPRR